MDELIFPQPTPAPLILPRRLSVVHSNLRNQKNRQQLASDDLYLGGNEYTRTYYYPTSTFPHHSSSSSSSATTSPTAAGAQSTLSNSPPAIFAFGGDRAKNGFITAATFSPPTRFAASGGPGGFIYSDGTIQGPTLATLRGQTNRRHSVASGSPWSTIPPKHALHMPIMKVNPEIWRSESHQREIHRLLHEGREEEVMRRRNIKGVMDTSVEEDEEDNAEMPGVVMTMDLGGFQASEDREKERVREEVMKEWTQTVEQQEFDSQLRVQQAEELLRRRSWPGIPQAQQQDQVWRFQSGQLSPDQQQQLLLRYHQIQQQQQQQQQQLRQHQQQIQQQMQYRQQQQQTPTQLPPPGMQHRSSYDGSGRSIYGQGPLDSGRWPSSSSSGGGNVNGSTEIRRASFTDYRN
ncbi:hypothetical protein BGZ96_002828 [Linnemannia gamsii]|uniref:Uncharacterized protein n=1 Tax=Linnemannia gamsii TaxID=64522 RepID=A0ABQ7JK88_9FUNG|nr:hypothetical protein BGZ96_002828 [Linnemannia gamsii]